MNKKGVSPLIATILLIVFAIALGTVVMSFGSSFEKGQGIAECRDFIKLQLNVDSKNEVCFNQFSPIKSEYSVVDVDKLKLTKIGEENKYIVETK